MRLQSFAALGHRFRRLGQKTVFLRLKRPVSVNVSLVGLLKLLTVVQMSAQADLAQRWGLVVLRRELACLAQETGLH